MHHFALWLAQTRVSLVIQTNLWIIPTVQSFHIVAIGIVMASVFMMDLRILGWAGQDQTLLQTARRFGPWLWGALTVLLCTGILMVIGEPVRELMSLAFWLKMSMLAIGISMAITFQRALSRNERDWEETRAHRTSTRSLAMLTFLVWFSIIILGRLIAYDSVWGRWSLMPVN
jgi:uncharacterized membrane protein SirB2